MKYQEIAKKLAGMVDMHIYRSAIDEWQFTDANGNAEKLVRLGFSVRKVGSLLYVRLPSKPLVCRNSNKSLYRIMARSKEVGIVTRTGDAPDFYLQMQGHMPVTTNSLELALALAQGMYNESKETGYGI